MNSFEAKESSSERDARILTDNRSATPTPYVLEIEGNCEECGGSGFDPGGIDPWGPETCPVCHGARTLRIVRNYLAEAFQIAANPSSTRQVERQHLLAIVQHCREMVSASVGLPEVAWNSNWSRKSSARAKSRSARSHSRGNHLRRAHREARSSRDKVIVNRKGETENAIFSTQRT